MQPPGVTVHGTFSNTGACGCPLAVDEEREHERADLVGSFEAGQVGRARNLDQASVVDRVSDVGAERSAPCPGAGMMSLARNS